MKRRDSQERDDAIAREQAEDRREKLLADLKAREEAGRQPPAPEDPTPDTTPEEPEAPDADAPAEELDQAKADASADAPPPSDET